MRPGDHPDFFRFPAPPGRSRESSIRLDRHGRFWHDDQLVEHRGMARAFASWIARHPDDGRFILTNGFDWTYFEVEDTPYFVQAVHATDGAPRAELSDGSTEPLDLSTIRTGSADAVYVRVKDGAFEARFTPQAQLQLEPWLVTDDSGRICVRAGERRFPVGERNG